MARLDSLLHMMISQQADGVRMRAGSPPELLRGDTAQHLGIPAFNERRLREFVREITDPSDLATLHAEGYVELVYEYEGAYFACSVSAQPDGLQAMFRPLDESEPGAAEELADALARPDASIGAPDDTADGYEYDGFVRVDEHDVGDGETAEDLDPARRGGGHRAVAPPDFRPLQGNTMAGGEDQTQLSPQLGEEGEQPAEPELPSGPSMAFSRGGRGARGPRGEAVDGEILPVTEPGPRAPDGAGGAPPRGRNPAWTVEYSRSEATQPPQMGSNLSREELHKLLRWMVEQDATDLHLTPKFPPTLRVDNLFQPSKGRIFDPEELERVIVSILNVSERKHLEEHMSCDLSYQVEGVGRFRINVFRQLYGLSAAIRLIKGAISSLEALNLPNELKWLTGQETGLVLFTGPTGSGKSTTMSAIIQLMNLSRQLHVLTLEAPIEYLFENHSCLIQQREVGTHTASFLQGLKDALRENPDVIMVGELRDLETVQMAISASETGHLILATMHANTTVNAVSRLVDVFPDNQKAGARYMIADVLRSVVNMRLLRHQSGQGLVPAVEFLKNNPAISNLIRENKLHQLRQVLVTARAEGMWPFEKNLVELYRANMIEYDVAYSAAPDKKTFDQYISGTSKVKARARKAKGG